MTAPSPGHVLRGHGRGGGRPGFGRAIKHYYDAVEDAAHVRHTGTRLQGDSGLRSHDYHGDPRDLVFHRLYHPLRIREQFQLNARELHLGGYPLACKGSGHAVCKHGQISGRMQTVHRKRPTFCCRCVSRGDHERGMTVHRGPKHRWCAAPSGRDVDQQASCRPPRPRTAATPPPPPLASQAVSAALCLGLLRGGTWRSLGTAEDINRPRRNPARVWRGRSHIVGANTHLRTPLPPPLFFCPRTHALTLRVLSVLFTMGLGDNLKVRAGLLLSSTGGELVRTVGVQAIPCLCGDDVLRRRAR